MSQELILALCWRCDTTADMKDCSTISGDAADCTGRTSVTGTKGLQQLWSELLSCCRETIKTLQNALKNVVLQKVRLIPHD